MGRLFLTFGLVACIASTPGCRLLKKGLFSRKHPAAQTDKNSDMYLGMVESVNPEQKFVLVRTEIRMPVAAGTKLETRAPNGTKASLMVTPEHKGNFLSADIVEGAPSTGDAVILPARAAIEPAAPPATAGVSGTGTPASGAPALIPPSQ